MNRRVFIGAGFGALAAAPLQRAARPSVEREQATPVIGIRVSDLRRPGITDMELLSLAFRLWEEKGGGSLILESGVSYDLGVIRHNTPIFKVGGLRRATLHGNGAKLRLKTDDTFQSKVLEFSRFEQVYIKDVSFYDAGYDERQNGTGAFCIIANGSSGKAQGLRLENIEVESALGALLIYGGPHRVSGIQFSSGCLFKHCYYGLNCMENGDRVSGGFSAVNPRRAYFVYGVSDHDLNVHIKHDGSSAGASACFLIKRYGRDTRSIRLRMTFEGALVWTSGVTIEHQPIRSTILSLPSIVEDIDLNFSIPSAIYDPNQMPALSFRSYLEGGLEERGYTNNVFDRVRISGDLGKKRRVIAHTLPIKKGLLYIAPEILGLGPVEASGFLVTKG